MIKIDRNIPPPATYKNGKQVKTKYPFPFMKVGDSFLKKCKPSETESVTKLLITYCNNWRVRHNPSWRFTTKKESGGIRIWRTK